MRKFKFTTILASAVGGLVLPALSWAGRPAPGSITFEPVGPTSIPTMGGLGLLILALVLGAVALQVLRERGAGGRLASFMATGLAVGALLSAGGGLTMINNANALIPISENTLTNPGGETLVVPAGEVSTYENQAGVKLKVTDLTLPLSCPVNNVHGGSTACETGLILANGDVCEINCLNLAPSDRRLKTDIEPAGTAANGLALYTFRYIGGHERYLGVMAQDVLEHTPSAVATMPNGFLAVNYAALGLEMTRVD